VSAVTTHILDTVRGEPATGVLVRLEQVEAALTTEAGLPRADGHAAETGRGKTDADGPAAETGRGKTDADGLAAEIGRARTDADGRIADLGPARLQTGTYRLVFETGPYLRAVHPGEGGPAFYPEVVVTFAADGIRPHYHVPLLLSPYSYCTYRGS